MKREIIDNKEFIVFNDGNIKVRFSTALNNVNYKKEDEDGKKNLEDLKEIFSLDKVVYVNQIHSSDFIDATGEEFKGDRDCDAIVTKDKNTLIGVFTADCVPVIAYDKEKEVIAAIHSGWKGTYDKIVGKTCKYMKDKYGCENIKVIIGPHVRQCCYEVSEDLAHKFSEKFGEEVCNGRMLNLEKCVEIQLHDIVKKENITSVEICTYCEEEVKMHSYRQAQEKSGRLFSSIFID
ncbi:TPA: peptidoglycan editing factor PgeF [Clostridium perfringens]|uniref:Purine nucleoside phosphorylase n=1 Tax=Clostridium perfringens TaxID=1502 RepID=A0A8H9QUC9_CLOPF|nr:peptidoglycan editing factor PgeF [Clostridium perfringens]HAT4306325.1 peptidoglycan editing factor PgeF [Clostridium perfringens]